MNDQQRLVYRLFRSLEGAGVLDHVVLRRAWRETAPGSAPSLFYTFTERVGE